jgi:exonuclease III
LPSHNISLLSINVNGNISLKIPEILKALPNSPKVICVQEAGVKGSISPGLLNSNAPSFRAFVASSEEGGENLSDFNSSLVTLVANEWAHLIRGFSVAPSRAATALQVGGLTIFNVYWPAGLENTSVYSVDNCKKAAHVIQTIDWIVSRIRATGSAHWCIGGDFNETILRMERTRISRHPRGRYLGSESPSKQTFLGDLMCKLEAVDIGAQLGNLEHTWARKHGPQLEAVSSSRLDRFLVSPEIGSVAKSYQVLRHSCSDHSSISLTLLLSEQIVKPCKAREWMQKKFIVPPPGVHNSHRREAYVRGNSHFAASAATLETDFRKVANPEELEQVTKVLFNKLKSAAATAFRQTNPSRPRRKGNTERRSVITKAKRMVVALREDLELTNRSSVLIRLPPHLFSIARHLDAANLRSQTVALPYPRAGEPEAFRAEARTWCTAQIWHLREEIIQERYSLDRNWDTLSTDAAGLALMARKFAKPSRPVATKLVPHPVTGEPTDNPYWVGKILLVNDRV